MCEHWAGTGCPLCERRDWTVGRVRREMPAVRVYLVESREEVDGIIRGRLRSFPEVEIPGGRWFVFDWQQIATALTNGTPLVA